MRVPVGALCAQVEPAQPEDSLRSAARDLSDHGLPMLPVARGLEFVGVVTEASLVAAMAAGHTPESPVEAALVAAPAVLPPYATAAEAWRTFERTGASALPVVDEGGVLVGVLTPSRLVERRGDRSYFGKVGGMATPFGVYLTNGVVSGGVGPWALVATGMVLFGLFFAATLVSAAGAEALPAAWRGSGWFVGAFHGSVIVLFLAGLRALPLAGTHAAEHMVVHAIERGEELRPETVSRMPRVHPRCGTNLAVGASIFLGLMTADWIPGADLRLLLAGLVTLVFWRPLGSWVQFFVTTKPPTKDQVEAGIAAGRQLLARMAVAPRTLPSVPSRLLKSGVFQIMAGAFLIQFVAWALLTVLNVPPVWRVYFGV